MTVMVEAAASPVLLKQASSACGGATNGLTTALPMGSNGDGCIIDGLAADDDYYCSTPFDTVASVRAFDETVIELMDIMHDGAAKAAAAHAATITSSSEHISWFPRLAAEETVVELQVRSCLERLLWQHEVVLQQQESLRAQQHDARAQQRWLKRAARLRSQERLLDVDRQALDARERAVSVQERHIREIDQGFTAQALDAREREVSMRERELREIDERLAAVRARSEFKAVTASASQSNANTLDSDECKAVIDSAPVSTAVGSTLDAQPSIVEEAVEEVPFYTASSLPQDDVVLLEFSNNEMEGDAHCELQSRESSSATLVSGGSSEASTSAEVSEALREDVSPTGILHQSGLVSPMPGSWTTVPPQTVMSDIPQADPIAMEAMKASSPAAELEASTASWPLSGAMRVFGKLMVRQPHR